MNAISVHILTKHHLSSEKLTLFLGHLFVKLYKEKETASQCPQTKSVMSAASRNSSCHNQPKRQLSPLLLVVSTESCSESGPMVRLADVTVGCKDRPEMGWRTTLAGTVLSGV